MSTVTGRTEWKFEQRAATMSLVTTGGGLLFGGDVAGRFRAFDQKSGAILWEVNLGSQVTGFPVSYAVNGRQYIAVSTGPGREHRRLSQPDTRDPRRPEQQPVCVRVARRFPECTRRAAAAARPAQWRRSRQIARQQRGRPHAASSAIAACRKPDRTAAAGSAATLATAAARFSRAQVDAGKKLYVDQQCATCHGASMTGTNAAPALADDGFRNAWRTRTLPELLDCTRNTMPPGRAGTLTDAQYQNLIAAILDANGSKPGTGVLKIRCEGAGTDPAVGAARRRPGREHRERGGYAG